MSRPKRSLDDDAAPDEIELARAVNERIRELSGNWGDSEYDFVCECTDTACYRSVRMTGHEYDVMRQQTNWRVVLPGHQRESDEIISYNAGRLIIDRRREEPGTEEAADAIVLN
jgi:hypothetical protein